MKLRGIKISEHPLYINRIPVVKGVCSTCIRNYIEGPPLDRYRLEVYTVIFDDLMKGSEFKKLRKLIGFSQSQLSKEMEVTIRSITRWETDVNAIPKMAELALRYLAQNSGVGKRR